ncbi:inovirus Gp2 family protein [Klebsiella sp. BIGb0407]|uniref:inovirus Gp2 family protein n=1 Tax=Klebsiella sp. BIGb0407 TaxID=2940603 RepID=UPI0021686515|nr:inovirus Gp2 family protein [Klebsiella sp. BIGb0407]MCS3430230.1 hypothetical protein [Klebsiella sp. BIGb0407]
MTANTVNNPEKLNIHQPSDASVINNIYPFRCSEGYIKARGKYPYNGVLWNVLHPESEYLPNIMKAIFDCVNQAYQLSSRILAIRYDLHLHKYSDDNQVISDFCKQLRKLVRSHYPKSFFSIFWVREQDKSASQHYHCVVIMDGNHIRTPYYLSQLVSEAWQVVSQGKVWFPADSYYLVDRKKMNTLSRLLLRLSYFAKRKSKTQIKSYIPLFGQKYYRCLKKRHSKSQRLKKCQPPAGIHSPLPGALDVLFEDESKSPVISQDKMQMVVGSQNKISYIRRLLALYKFKELPRKPALSAHWLRHFDSYYSKYWPCGISVAQYAHWHYLNPATARRYLCNYPAALVSPAVLRHFLQRVS